jgi:hypothetical protein
MTIPARAPAVAQKLEAARLIRTSLDQEVGQAALDAAEGVRGADRRLSDLRVRIAVADRDVAELEAAHILALKKDSEAELAARCKLREAQLAEFGVSSSARVESVAEICEALAKLASAYQTYVARTKKMTAALPLGCALPLMGIGADVELGSFVGNLSGLIAAEAFRKIDTSGAIRAALPFARAPRIGMADHPEAVPSGSRLSKPARPQC